MGSYTNPCGPLTDAQRPQYPRPDEIRGRDFFLAKARAEELVDATLATLVEARRRRDAERVASTKPEPRRSPMLLALVVILLIFAIAGGVVIHPLLFLLALLAVVVLLSAGRRVP